MFKSISEWRIWQMVPRTCSGSHAGWRSSESLPSLLNTELRLAQMVQRRRTLGTEGEGSKEGWSSWRSVLLLTLAPGQLIYLFLAPSSHNEKHILRQIPIHYRSKQQKRGCPQQAAFTQGEMAQDLWLALVTKTHLKWFYTFSSKWGTKWRIHSAVAGATYVALAIFKIWKKY